MFSEIFKRLILFCVKCEAIKKSTVNDLLHQTNTEADAQNIIDNTYGAVD